MRLIALAEAATPVPRPFNDTFFATAATVIPVLFLAIAVQGRAYDNLLKTIGALLRRAVTGPWYQQAAAAVGFFALAVIALFILAYGSLGEVLAIYALYQQQATVTTVASVFAAVTFMVIMTAALPALAFGRAIVISATRGSKWILTARPARAAPPNGRRTPARPPVLPKWAKQAQRLKLPENVKGR